MLIPTLATLATLATFLELSIEFLKNQLNIE